MSATFNGRVYGHRMIADRQREVAVSLKALGLMQAHHGNKYLSFLCVSRDEEKGWYAEADKLVPLVECGVGDE